MRRLHREQVDNKVLESLGLPTNNQLHLGRKMGSINCEMMELDPVLLVRIFGN